MFNLLFGCFACLLVEPVCGHHNGGPCFVPKREQPVFVAFKLGTEFPNTRLTLLFENSRIHNSHSHQGDVIEHFSSCLFGHEANVFLSFFEIFNLDVNTSNFQVAKIQKVPILETKNFKKRNCPYYLIMNLYRRR